ncbi:MAG TPA: YdcF family protein [Candidatus Nitrosotalea sp.]|nr:YdcF family protein [Candidatus Nitrosotalea sp.]
MKRRLAIALVATLALAVVAVAVHRPVLRAAGRVLVVESPRERADAIVVVAGSSPSREALAAARFREGLAPLVLVSRQFVPNRVRQLIDLGIRPLDFQGESVAALEKYGVPRNAIITLAEPVEITETEVRGVVAAARARGWHRVLLVTTAFHSRRVRLIWSREAGPGIEAGVAVVHDECSSGPAWWRRRRCSETVLHEYLGLLALYLHISSLMR